MMSEQVHREERASDVRLRIIADTDPLDPRTDRDNAGTILCCDHRHYALGDRASHACAAVLVRASCCYRPTWEREGGLALDLACGLYLWTAVHAAATSWRCRASSTIMTASPCRPHPSPVPGTAGRGGSSASPRLASSTCTSGPLECD